MGQPSAAVFMPGLLLLNVRCGLIAFWWRGCCSSPCAHEWLWCLFVARCRLFERSTCIPASERVLALARNRKLTCRSLPGFSLQNTCYCLLSCAHFLPVHVSVHGLAFVIACLFTVRLCRFVYSHTPNKALHRSTRRCRILSVGCQPLVPGELKR